MNVKYVATLGVADDMEKDPDFREFVKASFRRFLRLDWGEISSINDILSNDANPDDALGSYVDEHGKKIWIKAAVVLDDLEVITVLYPNEW